MVATPWDLCRAPRAHIDYHAVMGTGTGGVGKEKIAEVNKFDKEY